MTENFQDAVTRLALKSAFAEVAERSLKEVIGESGTSAFLYHMGGSEILQDPNKLENGLKTIFGPGAEPIMEYILKNME